MLHRLSSGPYFSYFSYYSLLFLICSCFSLLFHENALLSLLFHSKMSFTRKNLGFYKLTSMFIQGGCHLTPKILMLNLKSLAVWLVLMSQVLSCTFKYEITYFKQLIVMNFIFGKALLFLLFYTDNSYFFTTFSKFLSLLFPFFSVDGHLKV